MADSVFPVAPTDVDSEHNTIRQPLVPFAFWQLDDTHFAFDSSVLLPSMTAELTVLIALVRSSKGALASIWGHTDTTGNDDYNKLLAGRRAMALHGLLTRNVAEWETLFSTPHGGDNWRRESDFALRLMRNTVGDTTNSLARPALFDQYMTALAQDADGKSFGMPQTSFLGKGADAKGKADFQGCSEFNPLIMFSAAEAKSFARPENKEARDEAGGPNRRVTVMLFPAETKVNVATWPCPRALEGTAGCIKRFWSDSAQRRAVQVNHREHPQDNDTFACRFYDRIAREVVDPRAIDLRFAHAAPPVTLVKAAKPPATVNAANAPRSVTAPSNATTSVSQDIELRASTKTASLDVATATTREGGGNSYHEFDLKPVKKFINLRAQLTREDVVNGASVGIDMVALIGRLAGPETLRRAVAFLKEELPPGKPVDAAEFNLQEFADLNRPFDNPFEPEGPPPGGRIPKDV